MPAAEANASNLGLRGDYRPYPTYKPSGAEWLGKIPAHWTVRRLKSFTVVQLSNVDKKSTAGQKAVRLCNYTDVYYREHIGPDVEFMSATATKEQIRRFSLKAGDVLITKDSEDWSDIAVPAVVTQNLPSILCGYHLALIRPHTGCDGRFLSRALAAIGPRDQYQLSANGITRYGLTGDSIRASVLALPPLPEQRAIAAFLDRETAKIDALVAKKERLIELLQEKRTALISRIVTKGIDPNVPMKDSGVEWFGEIPAHWEVKPLRWAVKFQRGHDLPSDVREEGNVPLVSSSGVTSTQSKSIAKAPGIVTGRYGTIGKFQLVCEDYWPLNTTLYSIDLYGNDPHFLHNMLSHLSPLFLLHAAKSAVPGVDRNDIHTVRTAVPPLCEQNTIAAFLHRETAIIDVLINKVYEAVKRLNEFRSALISAAVTGRIDVREEAA